MIQTAGEQREMALAVQNAVKMFGYQPFFGPTLNDMRQACSLFFVLDREYPGYHWVVEIRDGLCTVMNETIATNWGWRRPANCLDADGKVIKMVGGGFLERVGLKRGGITDKIQDLATDLRGNIKRLPGANDGDINR